MDPLSTALILGSASPAWPDAALAENSYASASNFLKNSLHPDTSVVFIADVEGSVPEVKMRGDLLAAYRAVDPAFNCVFIEFPARMDAGMARYIAGNGTNPSFDETFVADLKSWLTVNYGPLSPGVSADELAFQTLLDAARKNQMKVLGADNPPELWGSDPGSISVFAQVTNKLEIEVGKVFTANAKVSPQDYFYGEEPLVGYRDLGFFLNMSRDIPANQCRRSIAFLGNAHLVAIDGDRKLGPKSRSNRMLPVTELMEEAGYKIQVFADSTLDCGDATVPADLKTLRAQGCAQFAANSPGTVLARPKQPGDDRYFPNFGKETMDLLEGFFLY